MNLVAIGCNVHSASVDLRERLAFDDAKADRALDELVARYDCEAVIVSTCNRVELYLARSPQSPAPGADVEMITLFVDVFEAWGFKDLIVKVNSVGTPESRRAYGDALRNALAPYRERLSEDSQRRLETNPLRVLDTKSEGDLAVLRERNVVGNVCIAFCTSAGLALSVARMAFGSRSTTVLSAAQRFE